jgi:replicative DNA helicase
MTDILKPKSKEFDYYKYDSSLNFLNIVMGSLRKSELNLVGARSGVGKTLFVMQNLSHWSESLKTLFISREMRSESLWKRILVRETGIDNTVFRDKTFTPEQLESIYRVNSMFKGRKLYLNSKISTISEIRRKLYEMNAQLLVVDYLQIMDSEGNHGSREREVAWLSRQLKKIATEFDIPVVVLTQLNDNSSENRPTGERDVRESKAPYQDSDNVIYLHKPTAAEVKQWIDKGVIDDETLEKFDLMEVNVVKQRDGEVKNTLCRHIKSQLRFTEIKPLRSVK